MDFKRLLLQQSIKNGPVRLSATEQLKLSRQQNNQQSQQQQQQQQQAPSAQPPLSLGKVMSPRSAWRFHTPRTDVLSSTIIEDAAAEEKAMKTSPENPFPPSSKMVVLETSVKRNVFRQNETTKEPTKSEKNSVNSMQASQVDSNKITFDRAIIDNREAAAAAAAHASGLSAFESRRLSNQMARAQFLASVSNEPISQRQSDLFDKRFRARSESPQHPVAAQNVTRSPSAPTLETAL